VAREADTPRVVRAGVWVYQRLLWIYPHTFQQRFGDELEEDFLALSLDAWEQGRTRALAGWWAATAADAARSIFRAWLSTPWLPISLISACVAAGVFWATIGRSQLPLRAFRRRVLPGGTTPPDSPELLLLMALMVLVPVVAILIVWSLSRLVHHQSPSRRGRA
jgi:hypothetical protein